MLELPSRLSTTSGTKTRCSAPKHSRRGVARRGSGASGETNCTLGSSLAFGAFSAANSRVHRELECFFESNPCLCPFKSHATNSTCCPAGPLELAVRPVHWRAACLNDGPSAECRHFGGRKPVDGKVDGMS